MVHSDDDVSDLSDDDGFSDASIGSSASGSGTRLTARQRAKEMGGEHGMELQSLPNSMYLCIESLSHILIELPYLTFSGRQRSTKRSN